MQKSEVKIPNSTSITIEGQGIVVIIILDGSVKLIHHVQYVPCLTYSLLSVNQLLKSGYSILFGDGSCIIHYKKTGQKFFAIQITKNRMFPFDVL